MGNIPRPEIVLPPHFAWKHPGLPTTWTRVLERNPEAMNPVAMRPEPLEGHVWLDTPGKVLHADERFLEFTDDPPAGS